MGFGVGAAVAVVVLGVLGERGGGQRKRFIMNSNNDCNNNDIRTQNTISRTPGTIGHRQRARNPVASTSPTGAWRSLRTPNSVPEVILDILWCTSGAPETVHQPARRKSNRTGTTGSCPALKQRCGGRPGTSKEPHPFLFRATLRPFVEARGGRHRYGAQEHTCGPSKGTTH